MKCCQGGRTFSVDVPGDRIGRSDVPNTAPCPKLSVCNQSVQACVVMSGPAAQDLAPECNTAQLRSSMAFEEHNPFETTLDKLSGSGAEQMKVPMRHLCHATKMLETRAGKKFCKLAGKMVDLAGNSLYYELLGSDEKDVKSKSRELLASDFVVVKKLQLQKNQFWAGYHASFGEKGSRTTFHPPTCQSRDLHEAPDNLSSGQSDVSHSLETFSVDVLSFFCFLENCYIRVRQRRTCAEMLSMDAQRRS